MRILLHCVVLAPLVLLAPAVAGEGRRDDLAALLAGVDGIGVPGVPGPLCVFGDEAFAVLNAAADGHPAPVVAAARLGRGRIVAFGHNGYLSPAAAGAERLFANAVTWCAGRAAGKGPPAAVAVCRAKDAAVFLRGRGHAVEEVSDPADPGAAKVLVLDAAAIPSPEAERALARFVRSGGGLVTASLGWGWLQLNPGKSLSADHPGNRLLRDAGLAFADGTLEAGPGRSFPARPDPSPLAEAPAALDFLRRAAAGAPAGKPDLAAASATVVRALRTLPRDAPFRAALTAAAARAGEDALVPTAKRPLSMDRALDRVLFTAHFLDLAERPPAEVAAHPAAAVFPGAVPPGSPRGPREVEVDTAVPDWASLGLYAPPGGLVRVSVPGRAARRGLSLRIGAHTDRNWHHDSWTRAPEVSLAVPLDRPRTEAANPFGGLLYVVVPRGCDLGRIAVEVEGAVEAPRFVAGETDPAEWNRTIRHRPAPWAEIASAKMIVTVPSRVVRDLDDPAASAATFDAILDLTADLAARPAARDRPERIVCDEQISAGYMHAGYPIMTWLDQERNLVDAAHLRKGNWGLFHEIGHNHQSGDWTFEGTVEVTVNLFTLFVFDRLCGVPPEKHDRTDAKARRKHMEYLRAPDFARWKGDPFLALTTYVQVQQAFGWQAFRDVFAEYRALPEAERPKSDAEKRDQLLVRLSRRTGKDLGGFFARWGIPVSEAARAAVADLPDFLPAEMAEFAR